MVGLLVLCLSGYVSTIKFFKKYLIMFFFVGLQLNCSHAALALDANAVVSCESTTLNNSAIKDLNNDNFAQAIQKFEKIIEIDPTYELAKKNLAVAYFRYGQQTLNPTKATEYLFKSFVLDPTLTPNTKILINRIESLSGYSAVSDRKILYQPIRVVTKRKGNLLEYYAFSSSVTDATVTLIASGENITCIPSKIVERGLSKNDEDWLLKVTSENSDYLLNTSVKMKWFLGSKGGACSTGNYLYRLPFEKGTKHKITCGHGEGLHNIGTADEFAVDFEMPEGTTVCAARDGIVVACQSEATQTVLDNYSKYQDNFIIVKHGDGTYGEYKHLQNNGVLVIPGQSIRTGQMIGLSGNTGHSTGPHLHFNVFSINNSGTAISNETTFADATGKKIVIETGQSVVN